MKFLLLGQIKDLQSGIYIIQSIEQLNHEVKYVDIRNIVTEYGIIPGQKIILKEINDLNYKPDIIIILKGLELSLDTLTKIKNKFKKSKLINWYFDIKAVGINLWENKSFFKAIELYDYFLCSLSGVAKKLIDIGFKNVYHIGEACFPLLHNEQYMNNFQKQKYGEDISFIGNIGYHNIHPDRIKYLSKIINEGFNIKIWGNIVCDAKSIPLNIRHSMSGEAVINERHSIVCQSSLINLGLDAMPELEGSMSARLYRVMCAGGLYLSTPTKGIEKLFKINKKGDKINEEQELVVFYDENDLIEKIDFLLENEKIRKQIAINGQKKVLSEHTFTDRIKKLIKLVEGKK